MTEGVTFQSSMSVSRKSSSSWRRKDCSRISDNEILTMSKTSVFSLLRTLMKASIVSKSFSWFRVSIIRSSTSSRSWVWKSLANASKVGVDWRVWAFPRNPSKAESSDWSILVRRVSSWYGKISISFFTEASISGMPDSILSGKSFFSWRRRSRTRVRAIITASTASTAATASYVSSGLRRTNPQVWSSVRYWSAFFSDNPWFSCISVFG